MPIIAMVVTYAKNILALFTELLGYHAFNLPIILSG